MTNIKLQITALAIAATGCAISVRASIPLDYYQTLQGLCGAELKTAVHQLVGDPSISMLSYGSGERHTWWGFYVTDRNADNSVVDRYSNDTRYFTNRGSSVEGMNIEHSFPKSWWGSASNNAYKDLYNLMPCEKSINSSKSNYPMGIVTGTTTSNGCTSVGTGQWGGKSWEPADKWKGDFARGYMYMATAYQNLTFSNNEAKKILITGSYPTLQKEASDLYIAWALTDDVDDIETRRNDNVESIQGNRNPFVDFPNLMHYIWGDSINTPIDLRFTRKSASTTGIIGGEGQTAGPEVELYSNPLTGDEGGFTTITFKPLTNGKEIWQNTPAYGWKATSFYGGALVADAAIVSSEIDLTDMATAYTSFSHAVNYHDNPSQNLHVEVELADGTIAPVDVPVWPAGDSWKFVESGKIPLDAFTGQKVRLRFHYECTGEKAATWEIKNLRIVARKRLTDIETIPAALDPDNNKNYPVEYYDLNGRSIDPASYRGIAIRRQGAATSKIVLR